MVKHIHIVNAISDSLMILNADCEIILTNDSWDKFNKNSARKLKKSKTGLTYLKIRKKATLEDKEREQQAHKGILSVINEEVDHFEMEYPCHSADGPQWFLLRVAKIKEVTPMVLLTHIDITAVKNSEEKPDENFSDIVAGVQQEKIYREGETLSMSVSNIIKQTADSFIVTDEDVVIIYTNNAAIELSGYSKEELQGEKPTILNSEKHRTKFYGNLWKTIGAGEVFKSVIMHREKNDELYHEETTITPIKNVKNEITNFTLKGRDISARVLTLESLEYCKDKFRAIYEYSRDAIIIHDGRKFLDCNIATLKMYNVDEKEDFLAMKLEDLLSSFLPNGQPITELIKEQFDKVLVAGTIDFEAISKRMDGTTFDSEILFTKIELNKKTIIQIIVRDISSQKITKEKLIQARKNFRALASRIERIREEEKTLIARNIHDDLGHYLTALLMDLHHISKKPECQGNDIAVELQSMISLTNSSIETAEQIAANLRPGILDQLGLSAALEWQLEKFMKRNEMKINVNIEPHDKDQLDQAKTTALFRIFQEILTNISRHAKATSLNVVLKNNNKNIQLFVSDNGIGVTNKNIDSINSMGLLGMRERTNIVGGEFLIFSPKQGGTEINVTIPKSRYTL